MGQTVYVDLYFLINVSMDLLCLMISASLLHRRVRRLRAILAALLGGAYAVAALLLSFGGVLGLACDLAAALLLCAICFGVRGRSPFRLLQATLVQLLVSMLLGGIMTALYTFLNRLHLPLESLQGDGLSVWMFALLSAVSGFATLRGGRFLGFSRKTRSVSLELCLFGQSVTLSALVDSGNLLRDPVSGKSVIVVELDRVASILPPALLRAYEGGDPVAWLTTHEHARRARPITVTTAAGSTLLLALVPDSLIVTEGSDVLPSDYLVAPSRLGSRAQDFDAIIGLQ